MTRGLSQEQLARLLGVSFATVNRWETGRTQMSARARQALAEFEAQGGQATDSPLRPHPARQRRRPAPRAPAPGTGHPGTGHSRQGPRRTGSAQAQTGEAQRPGTAGDGQAGRALPVAQSSFIGRDQELAELIGLLDHSRLLTLIGPGGAGKTRLAIEAIRRMATAVPVAFVPLETVRQPESLVTVVAAACGCRTGPGCRCRSPSSRPWPRHRG